VKNIKVIILATYEDLFKKTSEPLFKKIKKYPLQVVLSELIGINYRLRPANKLVIETNLNTQAMMIIDWIGFDPYVKDLIQRILTQKGSRPEEIIIFNRAACLYGIDFCLRNLQSDEEEFNYTREFWIDLIEFCLACNTIVTNHENADETTKVTLLEHVNAQQALLNELKIISNPILTVNRCIELFRWFQKDTHYSTELTVYLGKLGLDAETFLEILILLYLNPKANPKIPFWINTDAKKSPETVVLLEWLSKSTMLVKKHDMDFLMLYKWPIYKYKKEHYFMLDAELLLDKMYRQLISDFYWDHLRAKGITYQDYRSYIGKFFEDYVSKHFKDLLASNRKITFKHTDQLSFGNPKKELCDIYLHHKKNVMLGQVKSTAFSDEQKFNGSFEFYREDLARFYSDVGVSQMIRSIDWLTKHGSEIDAPFPSKTKLFPVLILNDKYFEIPMMTEILNIEFRKQLATITTDFIIKDLVVMSVSSIERLHAKKVRMKKDLWQLFWDTQLYSGILPHFNNTLDRFNIQFNPKRELKRVKTFLNLKKK
jgi:hypothetical protein